MLPEINPRGTPQHSFQFVNIEKPADNTDFIIFGYLGMLRIFYVRFGIVTLKKTSVGFT
ncbi:MAG: hypothetical protein RR034_06275 [Bacteroidales bacterium]